MTPAAPAWGPLLAWYVVLVGVPTGLTLAGWRLEQDETPRWVTWTALLLLGGVSLLLMVDLGRPERFFLMLTRFGNLASPIAIGAKLIALKMFLLMVILALGKGRPPRGSGRLFVWLLAAVSFALALYPSALLARSKASPLAGSSGSALLFLATSLVLGTAVYLAVLALTRARPELLAAARALLITLMAASGISLAFTLLALAGWPEDRTLADELVSGRHGPTFWGLVIGTGLAVPSATLTFFPRSRAALVIGAVTAFAGAATLRYLLFSVGQ